MGENIQTQFKSEGQPLHDASTENDNSTDSSTETNETEQTGSSDQDNKQTENKDAGDDTNFADHPRWKEREGDWTKRFNDQEERHVSELQTLREEFGLVHKEAKKESEVSSTEVPP